MKRLLISLGCQIFPMLAADAVLVVHQGMLDLSDNGNGLGSRVFDGGQEVNDPVFPFVIGADGLE